MLKLSLSAFALAKVVLLWMVFQILMSNVTLVAQVSKAKEKRLDISRLQEDSVAASAYIELSNSFLEQNKLDSCRWAAIQAKVLSNKAGLGVIEGWADYLIGAYFFYEGQYDEGIRIETAVMARAENLGDDLLKANALKLIAWMYTEIGRQKEALLIFKDCLPVFKKFKGRDIQMNIGICLYGIATTHFYLGELNLAKVYLDSALMETPPMDVREKALALADRAAVFRNLNQLSEAEKDAISAVALLKDLPLQKDALAYAEAELALTLASKGNWAVARSWAIKSHKLYSEIPLIKRYVSVYVTLSETFQILNDFERAFQIERETRLLEDSIYKWRKLRAIDELKLKYESDKKNLEIEKLRIIQLQQEFLLIQNRTALLALIGFVVAGGVLTLFLFKKREKYQKRITNLEVERGIQIERERLSKDLHDSLGTQLSTISIYLNQLANLPLDGLTMVKNLLENVISELRDSIWIMQKQLISYGEIEQRIHNLFWRYRKTECPVQLQIEMNEFLRDKKIDPEDAGNVFRIIQEATHNAIKHSKGNMFKVSFEQIDDEILITIFDNGIGFDLSKKLHFNTFGLTNIKARAEQIGAALKINTGIGAGVQIELKLRKSPQSSV